MPSPTQVAGKHWPSQPVTSPAPQPLTQSPPSKSKSVQSKALSQTPLPSRSPSVQLPSQSLI